MKQIVFFEGKNFKGRSCKSSTDCPDLRTFFTRCNSVRVENGNCLLYEMRYYVGNQYFLKKGEYPDLQQCLGSKDLIRSCPTDPNGRFCGI
uniref:Beta/gamma crystallin 'Greek key' domain-containing protein n=1 Tax=Leptobrachium leishanense TaxID=445787 RepID=A0A8C5Q3K0_9ANUR